MIDVDMAGEQETAEDTKLLNQGTLAMVVTHALVHAAGNIRSTIMPYLKEDFMLNNLQVGIITAVPPLAQALTSIPAGWISDRYGAKKLVAISVALAALGALVAGFSVNPWMFVVSATLFTLTSTFYHPPAHSYTARVVEPKNRAKAMGYLNAGGTFGVAVGPLSVSILMGYFLLTWKQLYLIWVAPIVLGLVLLLLVKTDPRGERNGENQCGDEPGTDAPQTLLTKEFILYITSRGVRMFGAGMVSAFLSIYLSEVRSWSMIQIGIMFGLSSVLGLIASPVGGFMAVRFGEKRWIILSLAASYAFLLFAFFTPGVYPFMALYLTYRFFGILSMPGMASITARLSPPDQIGMGYALTFMPSSITGIVAPMVAAVIADAYGYLRIFTVAIAIMYGSLLVFNFAVKSD